MKIEVTVTTANETIMEVIDEKELYERFDAYVADIILEDIEAFGMSKSELYSGLEIYRKVDALRYEAWEDNGGGLYLFAFDESGDVIYAAGDFEYSQGSLRHCIYAIECGENPVECGWESSMYSGDQQPAYDQITDPENVRNGGAFLIADNEGIYRGRMGNAGSLEFAE